MTPGLPLESDTGLNPVLPAPPTPASLQTVRLLHSSPLSQPEGRGGGAGGGAVQGRVSSEQGGPQHPFPDVCLAHPHSRTEKPHFSSASGCWAVPGPPPWN